MAFRLPHLRQSVPSCAECPLPAPEASPRASFNEPSATRSILEVYALGLTCVKRFNLRSCR